MDARLRGLDPTRGKDKLHKGGRLPGTQRLLNSTVNRQRLGLGSWMAGGRGKPAGEVGCQQNSTGVRERTTTRARRHWSSTEGQGGSHIKEEFWIKGWRGYEPKGDVTAF